MNILSSFTQPHVIVNLYDFFFTCRTQKVIFFKDTLDTIYNDSEWGPGMSR